MKHLSLFLFFLSFSLFSQQPKIIEGTLKNTGLILEADTKSYEIQLSATSLEFTDLTNQKVRILCDWKGNACSPIRYEIAPFANDNTVPDWTLKRIPYYVTGDVFSFNPQVTNDGKYLFWTSLVKEEKRNTQKIWVSEKDENGFWGVGKQLDKPLNNKYPSAIISALPGGNELFVFGTFGEEEAEQEIFKEMRERELEIGKQSSNTKEYEARLTELKQTFYAKIEALRNRAPFYRTYKEKLNYSDPKHIAFPEFYNLYRKKDAPNQQIFGSSTLSSSGKTLIFSVEQKNSKGKLDLYLATLNERGEFGNVQNLGDAINTTEEEMAPFLAGDDRTLYFSSGGFNGLSIYVSKRLGNGWNSWSKPEEVSSNLRNVNFLSIPASGVWAYASKDGRLYMSKLGKTKLPDAIVTLSGKVKDETGKPIPVTIHYESLTTKKELGTAKSNPDTGEFTILLPYNDLYGIYVSEKGFLPASKSVDLRNKKSASQDIVLEFPPVVKIEKGKEITLENLFFDSGKHSLKPESESELERLSEILNNNPTMKVVIEGFTDNKGKPQKNKILSEKRAESVKEFLVKKEKIDPSRLSTKGFGQERPFAPNDTPEGRAKNRRVMLLVTEI